ncbi:hypothetical protein Slin14017_G018510 [Septoria linicola]|nr:hypothetical protein Slin14017_G018510 [Septoria linicola]
MAAGNLMFQVRKKDLDDPTVDISAGTPACRCEKTEWHCHEPVRGPGWRESTNPLDWSGGERQFMTGGLEDSGEANVTKDTRVLQEELLNRCGFTYVFMNNDCPQRNRCKHGPTHCPSLENRDKPEAIAAGQIMFRVDKRALEHPSIDISTATPACKCGKTEYHGHGVVKGSGWWE